MSNRPLDSLPEASRGPRTPSQGRASATLILGILTALPFLAAIVFELVILADSPNYRGIGSMVLALTWWLIIPMFVTTLILGYRQSQGPLDRATQIGFWLPIGALAAYGIFSLIITMIFGSRF